ncbi:hypothetical protein BGZ73_006650 [Actinomortierella ambigua]|nr:hypothetical protein BGZ73_006650 [Actinomortierella ambigua]
MATNNPNPRNFANLPKDELREIAAKGGRHSHTQTRDSDDMEQTADVDETYDNQDYDDDDYEESGETGQRADTDKSARGFASMDADKQHAIASKGGHAAQERSGFSHMDPEKHHEASVKGGHESQAHGGGFSNMPKDRLREVASKGGQAMQHKAHHGGF